MRGSTQANFDKPHPKCNRDSQTRNADTPPQFLRILKPYGKVLCNMVSSSLFIFVPPSKLYLSNSW